MLRPIHKSSTVRRIAAVAAGLAAAAGPITPAYASGAIQCGDVITADVTLGADLFCSGDGLIVGAGDLIIDLHGHTIHGSGTGFGIRYADASAPHVDADVVNGTITGFTVGIGLAEGDTDVLIKYVRLIGNGSGITGSLLNGVEVRGGEIRGGPVAMAADASTGVVIASVRIADGVVSPFNGSQSWVIKGCVFANASIDFAEANNSIVRNSRFTGTPIVVFQSNRITLLDNDLVDSPVRYSSGFGGVIRGNRLSGSLGGVNFDQSSGTTTVQVERNTFRGTRIGVQVVRDALVEIEDMTVSYNVFDGNLAAGVFVQALAGPSGPFTIHDNKLTRNGFASGGLTDRNGRPVNDGLHTALPVGSGVVVARNDTAANADFGIEALPVGSVVDGGGNRSTANPSGCAGVVCI